MDRTVQARQAVDEYIRLRAAGESEGEQQFVDAHRELMPELGEQLRMLRLIDHASRQSTAGSGGVANAASAESDSDTDSAEDGDREPATLGAASYTLPGYEIIRRIRGGGQGVVYRATQKATGRDVAIKVMRAGSLPGSRDRIRFEREIRILGTLSHPNIVTIHDGGVSAGDFYYVMDYIHGDSLDASMSSGARSDETTLRLFVKICDAVNAAHLRGIIHRDLKPSNIRVDCEGEPHVLDFGLAKLETDGGADEAAVSVMTMTGQFVGSLPWASPEQAEGSADELDVRTDVYSLGVILYQMLTGRFPYEIVGNIRQVMDNIVNAEPARPSSVRAGIDDDVETIVLRCLSKERDRRYQSAGDLARDVRRYLAGEPIESKRDSAWYVLRKTVRRHRTQAVALAGVFLLIIGFAIAMSVLYRRSAGEAAKNHLLASSLEDLLAFDRRDLADGQLSVVDHLDRIVRQNTQKLDAQPEVQARFLRAVSSTYGVLGDLKRRLPLERKLIELYEGVLSEDDRALARAHDTLGTLLSRLGDRAAARPHLRKAEKIIRRVCDNPDPELAEYLCRLAGVAWYEQCDRERGKALYREGVAMRRALHPSDHAAVARGINGLAGLLHDMGEYGEAERLYGESIAMYQRLDPGNPLLHEKLWLGLLYKDTKRYARARPLIDEAIEGFRKAGDDSRLSYAQFSLGRLFADMGDWSAAEEQLRVVADWHRRTNGAQAAGTARWDTELGRAIARQGRYEEAVTLLEPAAETLRKKEPASWESAKTESILGFAYIGLGRYEEAEPLLLGSLGRIAESRGPNHRRTKEAIERIVVLYERWRKPDLAAQYRIMLETDAPADALDTTVHPSQEPGIDQRFDR